MNYLKLENIEAYRLSYELSNIVWNIVIKWESFAKYSIGQQYVNAIDSISANIAEGFGRYTKKDKIRFYHIAKGSLLEGDDWTRKALQRNLISIEERKSIFDLMDQLPKSINSLIKYTNDKLNY